MRFDRPRTRLMGCAFSVGLLALFAAACADAPEKQPARGLILITVDTLRADHVGGYGSLGLTPNIDALAARGVRVERTSTPTPTTGPSHASLFTGHHPWRHGVLANAVPFTAAPQQALAEVLKQEQFATAAFVSSYVLAPRFGFDRGFDTYGFEPTLGYTFEGEHIEGFWTRGEETSNAAMAWLGDHVERGGPFFLWVHYFDPHSPYAPPGAFLPDQPPDIDLAHKTLPPQTKSWGELRDLIVRYRGEVRYADSQVGRLLDHVKQLGLEDEVTIVLTSDHGEGLGDHGLLEHGRNLHQELLRVPLIVAGPGIPRGIPLPGPAQLEDLYPTILSLLGVERSLAGDGVDLAQWLQGQASEAPRNTLYGRRKRYTDEPELYFRERGSDKWIGPIEGGGTRYHLGQDPRELTGQKGVPIPKDLGERIARDRNPAPAGRELDEEAERALRALGYIE